jgi:hypothetical protein
VARAFSVDASYVDPMMRGAGHDGIDAMIAGAQGQFPGYRFELDGTPDGHNDVVRFSWTLGLPGTCWRCPASMAWRAGEPRPTSTGALPFLPVTIRKDGVELNLFTAIATLGTPHDVTVHELRVESFFPADAASAEWFRARYGQPGLAA